MVVGVIFDIDGTLVTFHFDVQGTRKALVDEMGRAGLDTSGLDLTTPTQQILDSARVQSEMGRGPGFASLRSSAFAILDEFESESSLTSTLIPGVPEVLDSLLARGARLGVLTNSGRRSASAVLARTGIRDRFEFVLTRDDTETMKPRPEGLELAAKRFGFPWNSIYYVGDSPFDVRAARSAGIRSVSVATGNYTVERLRSEGADYAIPDLGGLAAVLGV